MNMVPYRCIGRDYRCSSRHRQMKMIVENVHTQQLYGYRFFRANTVILNWSLVKSTLVVCFIHALAAASALPQLVGQRHYSCRNSTACSVVNMKCSSDQRLAILSLRHAHLNTSGITEGECPVKGDNCSAVPVNLTAHDCGESYDEETLIEMFNNCSAVRRQAADDSVTCRLALPSSPEDSSGACESRGYERAATYSLLDYACINESQIMPMCSSSDSNGTLLFALWNPREQSKDITNVTSRCQCRVTSADDAQMYVYVRPMDVRLPSADTDDCSLLTLQDLSSTMLNSSCRNSSPLLFGTHLLQTGEIQAKTPIDLTLLLHQHQLPYMAWIGFSSYSERLLKLTCYLPDEPLEPLRPDDVLLNKNDSEDNEKMIGAVIGGCLAGLVLTVIVGATWFYLYSKRKRQMSKSSRAWWSKRRQENEFARSSASSRSSNVIVDTGKHMGYGAKPPIHKSYPASPHNQHLDIVTGSAAPQPSG